MTQASVFFLWQLDGWHIVIKYDEDNEVISNEAYASKEECSEAFDQWCQDTGTTFSKAQ